MALTYHFVWGSNTCLVLQLSVALELVTVCTSGSFHWLWTRSTLHV